MSLNRVNSLILVAWALVVSAILINWQLLDGKVPNDLVVVVLLSAAIVYALRLSVEIWDK